MRPLTRRAPPSPFRRSVTGKVSVVAHRGLSAAAPENTMSAFRLAADAGADLVELDIHRSADGELVVIHDDTLDRTTNGTGHVRDHTLAEIRTLDASFGQAAFAGERVPTLDEVVRWARGTTLALSLEIKQPHPRARGRYPGIAERVADVVTAHRMVDRVLVHSFDHPTVRRMRELAPEIATGLLYGRGAPAPPRLLALPAHASGIHPWWGLVAADLCGAAHEAAMHVHAWGLAEPLSGDAVEVLVRAGIDSLGANDPRALGAILSGIGDSGIGDASAPTTAS